MIVILTKEITVGGEKVKELTIRAPEYDEIAKFGMPFSYSDNGSAKIDMSCTLAYLPVLADIPPSSAKKILPKDLITISMQIVGFFTASEVSMS